TSSPRVRIPTGSAAPRPSAKPLKNEEDNRTATLTVLAGPRPGQDGQKRQVGQNSPALVGQHSWTQRGVALPVLPLHVHGGLGLGTFVVGLVTGSQFVASLVSRVWAGR